MHIDRVAVVASHSSVSLFYFYVRRHDSFWLLPCVPFALLLHWGILLGCLGLDLSVAATSDGQLPTSFVPPKLGPSPKVDSFLGRAANFRRAMLPHSEPRTTNQSPRMIDQNPLERNAPKNCNFMDPNLPSASVGQYHKCRGTNQTSGPRCIEHHCWGGGGRLRQHRCVL